MALRPKPNTPTVDFNYLKELLLSKDLTRSSELDWVAKDFRFLNGKNVLNESGDHVALMTFPRSGNSFLRRYLELITGIYTGSDIDVRYSAALQMHGLLGE